MVRKEGSKLDQKFYLVQFPFICTTNKKVYSVCHVFPPPQSSMLHTT